MNLTLDIGNSRTKANLFKGRKWKKEKTWKGCPSADIIKWIEKKEVNQIILIDSGACPMTLMNFLNRHPAFLHFTDTSAIPIRVEYETAETLGKDRLAGAVGAWAEFKKQAILTIDTGTCITLNFISKKAAYKGGAILPGLQMRLDAMHHFTDKLPQEELKRDIPVLGKNTRNSLISGALNGARMEINGWVQYFSEKYAPLTVILTGGQAKWFESHLKYEIFARPNLVAVGLNEILIFNEI